MTTTESAWRPTDDQQNLEIWPVYDGIIDRLKEMQSGIGCPDRYVVGLLEAMATAHFSPEP